MLAALPVLPTVPSSVPAVTLRESHCVEVAPDVGGAIIAVEPELKTS